VQNKNPFGRNGESFKVMNLEMERVRVDGVKQQEIEKRYAKYLKDMSRSEFEEDFLMSEGRIEEVFSILTGQIEKTLFVD
jgi:hypothetical protein